MNEEMMKRIFEGRRRWYGNQDLEILGGMKRVGKVRVYSWKQLVVSKPNKKIFPFVVSR